MQALPIKLQGILQGYQHILPELVIAAWILVSIVGDLFLVGGGEKSTRSWRYLIAQIGLILSLILAYQRMEQGIEGFVSFHMLWVNPGANAINCLILSIGFIIISIKSRFRNCSICSGGSGYRLVSSFAWKRFSSARSTFFR